MKLPEVTSSQVPSLGRRSTALPARMYRSQRMAVDAFQNAMDTFGNIGIKIYEQNAAAEHSKLRTEYMDRMNAAQAAIEKEPYRQVLDNQGEPTGELVSRHAEILNEFNTAEKRIRDEVLAKSTNSLAFRKLTEDLDQGGMAYRERTRTTAANWAVADASRNFRTSFRTNIANNNFKAAEQDLVAAVKTGAVSAAEQNRYATEILAKRQYRTGELLIEGIAAETYTLERVHELHRVFDEGENYVHLLPAQREALHSALNYKVGDMMAEDIAFTIDHFSLEDGADGILDYAERRWDKAGFSDPRAFESTISRLWGIYNNRKARDVKSQKVIETNMYMLEIMAGAPADPKKAIHRDAMDLVFDYRVNKLGAAPGSNEWIRVAGQQLRTQGWFPPKVESYVRMNLLHDDPQSVMTAAKLVAYADRHAGRSLTWLDKKDIATGLLINELVDAGIEDMDAFAKVREGIETVDETTIAVREAAYDGEFSQNSYAVLEERVGDDEAWWRIGTPEIRQTMVERYDRLRRTNFILTGNKEVADNMAYNELMRTYGITTRYGGRHLERKPPEAVKTDAPPEKVQEYVEDEWNQILEAYGLDEANTYSVYKLDNSARDSWYIYDVPNGEFVTNEEGMILKWTPSYSESRIGQRDRLRAEQQRIDEEIEVERQRQAYDAKMGLYEMFPSEMSPSQRVKHDLNLLQDTLEQDIRAGAKATDKFMTEDIPAFMSGAWNASRQRGLSEGKERSRTQRKRLDKYERMVHELEAEPGTKLHDQIMRMRQIEAELEALE